MTDLARAGWSASSPWTQQRLSDGAQPASAASAPARRERVRCERGVAETSCGCPTRPSEAPWPARRGQVASWDAPWRSGHGASSAAARALSCGCPTRPSGIPRALARPACPGLLSPPLLEAPHALSRTAARRTAASRQAVSYSAAPRLVNLRYSLPTEG